MEQFCRLVRKDERRYDLSFAIINRFEYKTGVQRLFQIQHTCLGEVSEEVRAHIIKHANSISTASMINMFFACNGRPIPSVDIVTVKALYGMEIIKIKFWNILEH